MMRATLRAVAAVLCQTWIAIAAGADFAEMQVLLKRNCGGCHLGKAPAGGFTLSRVATEKSLEDDPRSWGRLLVRVRDGEMPPPAAPALAAEPRERLVKWVDAALFEMACADGISPGPAPIRRLNRNEYAASVRDLLNIHVNAGQGLPADGAGGEGFDNAAETLFLSPIHAEKYLAAAKMALEYAFKDPRSRSRFLAAKPDAAKVIDAFLPRAFRRPARPGEAARYLALFQSAQQQRGEDFDGAMRYALQAVLMSPHFLFRIEAPNPDPGPRLLDQFALATRLSYFLWGSQPDDALRELAEQGKLGEPATLRQQVERMLKDVKALESSERFVEQWLGTRELGRDIKPDAKLFPEYYDEEVQSGMRYEPVIFFQEVLAGNLPLTDLIDSKWTVLSNKLERHYGIKVAEKLRQQPKKVDLPDGSHRGGLLGMAAIHAVSSLPNRTSPVLRGKWILEAMLGSPPPPPPPNVPELPAHDGANPATLRERLMAHRANPVCAGCHNKIDPLGFGLENFDVLGRWRTVDAEGRPIDARGELPDGTHFEGVDGLKQVLAERKDEFMRNLAGKMLGYALGRGLTREESCTVERIVAALKRDGYRAHTLVNEIVQSVPFRYQAGVNARAPVPGTEPEGK